MGPAPGDWERFVVRHTAPGNLVVHAVSFVLFWGSPLVALVAWDWRWLVGYVVSGPLGAAGHWLFEDGDVSVREATFQPAVPIYVAIMFWKLLRRQWREEIAKARDELAR